MSFLERAKQAAGQARQAASDAAVQARQAAAETSERAGTTLRDPATRVKAEARLHIARRTVSTAVERIDPGILAEVIIKATSIQERANAALRNKGSNYRIGTVSIGAAIPPSVSFAIVRVGDPKAAGALGGEPLAEVLDEGEHLAAHDPIDDTITALDGTQLSDADLALHDAAGADPVVGHEHPEP